MLTSDPEILLDIYEPATGNLEEHLFVPVSINAVFSKYSITPSHGINFGPLEYNTSADPCTVQIPNLGEFPIDFALYKTDGDDDEVLQQGAKGIFVQVLLVRKSKQCFCMRYMN